MKRLMLIAILTMVPALAHGAIYYVAKNGNDSYSCSQATSVVTPKLSINSGLGCLRSGDTLYIKRGTYVEAIDNFPAGTASARVVVAAFPGDERLVVIRPNAGGVNGDAVRFYNTSYVTLSGVVVDGTNVPVQAVRIQEFTHHVRIEKSEIRNAPRGNCIGEQNNTIHHNEYVKNYIHHCGADDQHHGVYLRGDYGLIEGNEISYNSGYGVHLWGSSAYIDNNVVRNNNVHHNGYYGILIGSGNNNAAYNNVVWENGYGGIRIGFNTPADNTAYNNTVYNNNGYCVYIMTSSSSKVKNNVCWQNKYNIVYDQGTSSDISSNLLNTDPSFLDVTGANFQLSANSAAIDKGAVLDEVGTDFLGVSRPRGNGYDIGAYEYVNVPIAAPSGLNVTSND